MGLFEERFNNRYRQHQIITGLKEGISKKELIDDYLELTRNNKRARNNHCRHCNSVAELQKEVVAEYTITIFGDVSGDGLITQSDMIMLKPLLRNARLKKALRCLKRLISTRRSYNAD